MEIQFGFNHEKINFLSDEHLDVDIMDVFVWDWMHCYFINGIFIKELEAFFSTMQRLKLRATATQFSFYLQLFQWPRRVPKAAKLVDAVSYTHLRAHET